MLQLLRAFGHYFKDPLPFIKRHLLYSLFIFLLNFALYYLMLQLVQSLFRAVLVDDFLFRLSSRALLLKPAYLLHGLFGNPLLEVMRPLVLYLTYTFAYLLSTIVLGTFIGYLSRVVQREESFPNPPAARGGGSREFFRGIKEELLMLSLSISWSAVLTLLAIQGGLAPKISVALFYIITPFFYGVYNLSYVFLRWGYSYADIWRAGVRRFWGFVGFSYASAVGYFAIYFLLSGLKYSHFAFMLLFGLNALFRPHGVINGAVYGIEFFRWQKKYCPKKGFFARIIEPLSILLAVATVVTVVQIYAQSQTKLDLVDCDYKIVKVALNTPDLKRGSVVEKGLRIFRFVSSLELGLVLNVKNRVARTIYVPGFDAELLIGKKWVARFHVSRFVLPENGERELQVTVKARGLRVLQRIAKEISRGTFSPLLRAKIIFRLWFGELRVPVRII